MIHIDFDKNINVTLESGLCYQTELILINEDIFTKQKTLYVNVKNLYSTYIKGNWPNTSSIKMNYILNEGTQILEIDKPVYICEYIKADNLNLTISNGCCINGKIIYKYNFGLLSKDETKERIDAYFQRIEGGGTLTAKNSFIDMNIIVIPCMPLFQLFLQYL